MLKWSELSARERDALVAEKVMDGRRAFYSTGIEEAWEVVGCMNRDFSLRGPSPWIAGIGPIYAEADTAPCACRKADRELYRGNATPWTAAKFTIHEWEMTCG